MLSARASSPDRIQPYAIRRRSSRYSSDARFGRSSSSRLLRLGQLAVADQHGDQCRGGAGGERPVSPGRLRHAGQHPSRRLQFARRRVGLRRFQTEPGRLRLRRARRDRLECAALGQQATPAVRLPRNWSSRPRSASTATTRESGSADSSAARPPSGSPQRTRSSASSRRAVKSDPRASVCSSDGANALRRQRQRRDRGHPVAREPPDRRDPLAHATVIVAFGDRQLRHLRRQRVGPAKPCPAELVGLGRARPGRGSASAADPHSRYGASSPGTARAHSSATARTLSGSRRRGPGAERDAVHGAAPRLRRERGLRLREGSPRSG